MKACVSCGREASAACNTCKWAFCSTKCQQDMVHLHGEMCFDPSNHDPVYVSHHLEAALGDVLDNHTSTYHSGLYENGDMEEMHHLVQYLNSSSTAGVALATRDAVGWINEILNDGGGDTARVMRSENFTLAELQNMIEYGLCEDRVFLAQLAHDPLCSDDEVDQLHTHLNRCEDVLSNILDIYDDDLGVRYGDLNSLQKAQIVHLITRVASKASRRRARKKRKKKAKRRRKKEKKEQEAADDAEAERDDTSKLRVFKRRKLKKKAKKHRDEADRQGRKAGKTESKIKKKKKKKKKKGGKSSASASASTKQRIRTRMGVLRYVPSSSSSSSSSQLKPGEGGEYVDSANVLYQRLLAAAVAHPTDEDVAYRIQSYSGDPAWCLEATHTLMVVVGK
jgi:hypothetical protein